MPDREVNSPVNTRYTGSKVGSISGQPLSPGARSDPSHAGGPKFDSVPPRRPARTATHQEEPPIPPSSTTVPVGPED